jgi:hypothetical protein
LDTVESIRERATRSRRLALGATDRQTRTDLLAYAHELEERANRLEFILRGIPVPPTTGAGKRNN